MIVKAGVAYERTVMRFGSQAEFIRATKYPQARVSMWKYMDMIPRKYWAKIQRKAKERDIVITISDLLGMEEAA